MNGSAGLGMTLQDLTPVAGSLATSKGAAGRLYEPSAASSRRPRRRPRSRHARHAPRRRGGLRRRGRDQRRRQGRSRLRRGRLLLRRRHLRDLGRHRRHHRRRDLPERALRQLQVRGRARERHLRRHAEVRRDLPRRRRPAAVRRQGREQAHPRQLRRLRRRRQERRGRQDLPGRGHRRQARPRLHQREGQRQGQRHRDLAGGRRRGGPAPTPTPGGGTELGDQCRRQGRRTASWRTPSTSAATPTRPRPASPAPRDDALYQTERYGNFKYSVAVKNGTYDVTLKFAEIYLDKAGQRLFDVKAENKLVLDNYDVFREAGGKNIAHDESFEVKVTDGRLDLEFISVHDNAKVGGIEIDYLA